MILPFLMIFLTGSIFSMGVPKLNMDKRPVYERCAVDRVADAAKENYSNAESVYKDRDIVATGIVKSIAKDQKSLTVNFDGVNVAVGVSDKSSVIALKAGEGVTVYGKLKFDKKDSRVWISADHLNKDAMKLKKDHYIYGGKSYKDSNSVSVSMVDDRITYKIPYTWTYTEVAEEDYAKIFNDTIFSDKVGKCYYINGLNGSKTPEVFCIFYFNNNKFLEKSGDRDKTYDIEKSIINNICPKEKFRLYELATWDFPTEQSTSSKGLKFDHYVANYDNYRAEFAFTRVKGKDNNDNGGLVVAIHLYDDDSIEPDDVLYVLDSIQIGK